MIDLYKKSYEDNDNSSDGGEFKYISYLTNYIWHNDGSYIYKKICHVEFNLSEEGYESHESTAASMIKGTYKNFTLIFYGSDNDDNFLELSRELKNLTLMKRLILVWERGYNYIVDSLSILTNLEYLEIDKECCNYDYEKIDIEELSKILPNCRFGKNLIKAMTN